MRILVIPTNDWVRFAGRGHIDPIVEKLAERQHQIFVWHFDLHRHDDVKRIAKGNLRLIHARTLPIREIAAFFMLNALLQFPSIFLNIRRLRVNVVVSENLLHGICAFIASGERILKVFDFSDYFPESASAYYSSRVFRKIVEIFVLFLTKMNLRLSDLCIVPCSALKEIAGTIDRRTPCHLVTNGVDLAVFRREKQNRAVRDRLKLGTHVIGFVGLVERWLDFTTVLQGLKTLCRTIPDVQLLIVGPDSGKYQDEIRATAEQAGVVDHIVWAGWVSYEKIPEILKLSTVCVMPFRTDTPLASVALPFKLFEYSACGRPILSTTLREVQRMKAGHVVFYRNAEEFAQKAKWLLTEGRNQYSKKAVEFAEEHDFPVLAAMVEDVILRRVGHSKNWR